MLTVAVVAGVLALLALALVLEGNRRDAYIVDPARQAELIREDKKQWVWIAGPHNTACYAGPMRTTTKEHDMTTYNPFFHNWWTVMSHHVTGDPFVAGDIAAALADFDGVVTVTAMGREFRVRAWKDVNFVHLIDPDTEAVSGDLDEAMRLVLGTMFQREGRWSHLTRKASQ